MNEVIKAYHEKQTGVNRELCDLLFKEIDKALPNIESKVWHGAPVWFIEGNPVVGYDVLKNCVRLLFWSGQTFEEPGLKDEGSFKAAEARYTAVDQINTEDLARWLKKAQEIQWNYKDIVKNRGVLERVK